MAYTSVVRKYIHLEIITKFNLTYEKDWTGDIIGIGVVTNCDGMREVAQVFSIIVIQCIAHWITQATASFNRLAPLDKVAYTFSSMAFLIRRYSL